MTHLKQNKFEKCQQFTWSHPEEEANTKFLKLCHEQAATLPSHMFQNSLNLTENTLLHLKLMQSKPLYKLLHTMPKGVLHHLHVDCNEDLTFIKKHVLPYPNIYIARDWSKWCYGTPQEAEKQQWLTPTQARASFTNEEDFDKAIMNITQLSYEEVERYSYSSESWEIFSKKIEGFFAIFFQEDLFKEYLLHMCEYLVGNGYSRIEVRAPAFDLKCRDPTQTKGIERVFEIYEEVQAQMQKKYPYFSLGVIVFGLKVFPPEVLEDYFRKIYNLNSPVVVGIDMVQEQDKFGDFEPYAKSIMKIQQQFPHKQLTGVYHAGETRNKKINNVWKVLQLGTHRIGHALNLLQHSHLMDEVREKQICIESNPLSNQFLNCTYDLELHPAVSFFNYGIPVSISSDDPARFSYNGTTPDFFVVVHAFHFDLKDLKLLAVYSIVHSLASRQEKQLLLAHFEAEWKLFIATI